MTASKPREALRQWLVSGVTPSSSDPRGLFVEARRQGLIALLASAPGFLESLSPEAREEWRTACRSLLVRGALQLDLARRAGALLEAASLRSLPLKGAALAERLYASAAERPMADVDLLALDAPGRAVGLLVNAGFTVIERADHAIALRDPASGGVLELHRAYTSGPGLYPVDAEGLWSRRVRGSGGEAAASTADVLVSLSLHAAFQNGHGLTLVQLLDFRRLLEREHPGLEAVLEAARAARAAPAVLGALLVARSVVGAEPDQSLLQALEALTPRAAVRGLKAMAARPALDLVAPERPSLMRARLVVLAGRRLPLLRHSLWPTPWPDEAPRTLGLGVRRVLRILRREAFGRVPAAKAEA